MGTLTINGKSIRVDDSFAKLSPADQEKTVNEIAAQIGHGAVQQATPITNGAAGATPPAGPMDFLTQGMSGINEGIAAGLGAPVDLATAGINLATTGVNKLTDMIPRQQNLSGLVTGQQPPNPYAIPQIEHPMGGSETFRGILAPTIKPETNDQGLQITRRVAKEVGAMLIPGARPVAMAEKPLEVAGRELLAATGSGTGAAVAQQAFPGNPIAEIVGQTVGGFSPLALESAASRSVPKVAPVAAQTVDDLRTAKNAAYKVVDDKGVRYTGDAYSRMMDGLTNDVLKQNISDKRHSAALDLINQMDASPAKRNGISMGELDSLRQDVYRDLIKSSNGGDRHFGEVINEHIDDFINSAATKDVIGGKSASDAANAILFARSANTKYRKAEVLATAIRNADLQAASAGSGGNINNALRQQFKQILTSPKKSRGFTKDELAAMEDLVRQGKAEDILRWIGKAAPGGNGLIGALEIVGTLHNPALAAMPLAGIVAKGIADGGTIKKAAKLQQMVSGSGQKAPVVPPPRRPLLAPPQQKVAAPLIYAQGANQPKRPLEITVPYRVH